jgi:hypothetical protein
MKKLIVSPLEIDRITQVIARRCEDMGVSLEWSAYASTAMTGHTMSGQKKIILPALRQPITQEAMDKLYGFVIHEAGHHSRPDCFGIMAALPKDIPKAIPSLFNIVEDDGMERDVAHAWKGDAVALGRQNSVIIKEIADSWAEREWTEEELTTQSVAPMSICALGQLSRLEWDTQSNASRANFFNRLNPTARELVDELVTEGWVDRLQETVDPHDCWDVALDLYKRLYPDADDDELEELRQQGHSMRPAEDGDDGEGKNGGMACDEGELDGEQSTEGSGESDDDTKGGLPDEGTCVPWEEAVVSEHDEWQGKELGEAAGNIGITWEDYTKGSVCLMPQNLVNVVDLSSKKIKPSPGDWRGHGTTESFMPDNRLARQFGNRVRNYLQSQARTKVSREKYSGRLDKSALTRLALPPIEGGEYNKRIFYEFTEKRELNTAIHVLTDWSGSMQGSKMIHAADASGRLVHVFHRVLKVPVQLAAFTDSKTPCDIGLIKRFNERSIGPEEIARRFSKFHPYSSANNDADSVMWAYNQLLRRKEKRRILIVLSDGAPAGGWGGYGGSHANLQHVASSIEKAGHVELWGVGIESNAVKNYYTKHKVLYSADEINQTLFDIIKDGAKR